MCDTPCHIVMDTLDRKSFLRASVRTYKHFSPCVWLDTVFLKTLIKEVCVHVCKSPAVYMQAECQMSHYRSLIGSVI